MGMWILQYVPTATLFLMMAAMGMGLRGADFRRILVQPRAAMLGIVGQLVLLPAAALAIAGALDLRDAIAVGLLLIAACPGGTVSNAFTYLARGDLALSISLTAVSSLVAFLWVPGVLGLALPLLEVEGATIELPFVDTALRLLLTTALPVLLGMALLRWRPHVAARLQRPLLVGSVSVLMLLIIALPFRLAADQVDLLGIVTGGLPCVALLLLATTGAALGAARLAGVDGRQARTLAIEVGIQNFNLAMVLALSVLGEPRYLGTGLVYLPAMLAVAAGLVWLGRRNPAAAG